MTPDEFFTEALPWAKIASAQTGVAVSVVLSQWGDEQGFEWPPMFNNPGNVGDPASAGQTTYPTIAAGVNAYVATMLEPDYAAVRAAPSPNAQAAALGQSPWAAGHYGIPPGIDLLRLMSTYDLYQYDKEGTETMTSILVGEQLHIFATINGAVLHWWQEIGPPASAWHGPETLPA